MATTSCPAEANSRTNRDPVNELAPVKRIFIGLNPFEGRRQVRGGLRSVCRRSVRDEPFIRPADRDDRASRAERPSGPLADSGQSLRGLIYKSGVNFGSRFARSLPDPRMDSSRPALPPHRVPATASSTAQSFGDFGRASRSGSDPRSASRANPYHVRETCFFRSYDAHRTDTDGPEGRPAGET